VHRTGQRLDRSRLQLPGPAFPEFRDDFLDVLNAVLGDDEDAVGADNDDDVLEADGTDGDVGRAGLVVNDAALAVDGDRIADEDVAARVRGARALDGIPGAEENCIT